MTLSTFVAYLTQEVQRYGSQRKAAAAWGLSQQYLCDVLQGRRVPGPGLVKAVGYVRRWEYEPVGEKESNRHE